MTDDVMDYLYNEWHGVATPQEIYDEEMKYGFIEEHEIFIRCVLNPNNLILGQGLWTEEWTGFKWEVKREFK